MCVGGRRRRKENAAVKINMLYESLCTPTLLETVLQVVAYMYMYSNNSYKITCTCTCYLGHSNSLDVNFVEMG